VEPKRNTNPGDLVRVSDAKPVRSFRLSPDAWRLISALAAEKGVSRAAIVEMAVRMFGKKESK